MNRVLLVGNIAKGPDDRSTSSGISCCTFTVACNRKYANSQGVREADFINCVALAKSLGIDTATPEEIAKYKNEWRI